MTAPLGPWVIGDNPAVQIVVSVTRNEGDADLDEYDTATPIVKNPAGTTILWDADGTIDSVAETVTIPFPASSPFATAGLYTMWVRLSHSVSGAVETTAPVFLSVLSLEAETTTWATISEVYGITGALVDLTDLYRAQNVIDIYANRTYAVRDNISARDRMTLKKALAWQVTWMIEQPDYDARHIVARTDQDGLAIDYENNNVREYAITLAPLAARAIRNLSWKGSRTQTVLDRRVPLGGGSDFRSESLDSLLPWKPM